MQSDDRQEFDRQISILCAAFDVPVGDRAEAYWRAFNRLSLIEFVRMVETAMGQDSDCKRVPSVAQLWAIRKLTRSSFKTPQPVGMQAALVNHVLNAHRLSERQIATSWNWITRHTPEPSKDDPNRKACEFLGVIVPQDPDDAIKYPAIRVMFADVDWRKYLEAA